MCVQSCKGVDSLKTLSLTGGEHGSDRHSGEKLA
jgi:hypothetical protein